MISNSSRMLDLAGVGNSQDIDFNALAVVRADHAIVSDVRDEGGTRVNQHNYLVYFGGRFWAMWSDGRGEPRKPPEEHRDNVPGHDLEGQHVSFATSEDGITWGTTQDLAGEPETGYGWIARGFWVRDGKLLALVARFVGPQSYIGLGLQLHAFKLQETSTPTWQHLGVAFDDAMNNFAPKRLPGGPWMMTRRDHVGDIYFLFGGEKRFDQWESVSLQEREAGELFGEEPYWWSLPDGRLAALFRDNNRSGYLFRAFSDDNGRTWSARVRTNFPDARSKFFGLELSDGRYVLVCNANPRKRDPLTIAVSDDGILFTKLGCLVGGRHVDYPHAIEQDGQLYVAFASAKQTVEVLRVPLSELDRI
ncbi:MAG: hypothetical protein CME19_23875 [Gemmatimonadetes bacterium]|nr:hypothetical protein [Gemmatimonadota bacterium]